MPIKALVLDWDGTLADTFGGNALTVRLKTAFYRHFRWAYLLAELAEAWLRWVAPLPRESRELIQWARAAGLLVGVATERTLFGFLKSAELALCDVNVFNFVHARRGPLDSFVKWPERVVIMRTDRRKEEASALAPLAVFLRSRSILPEETLLVGDANLDRLAAAHQRFWFIQVDRNRFDFGWVYKFINANKSTSPS